MPNKQTHIDPQYLTKDDMPHPLAPASEWLAYYQRVAQFGAYPSLREFAAKRVAFWETQVKPAQPVPLTNEQRRARRKIREG